jgi:hypothetical protein
MLTPPFLRTIYLCTPGHCRLRTQIVKLLIHTIRNFSTDYTPHGDLPEVHFFTNIWSHLVREEISMVVKPDNLGMLYEQVYCALRLEILAGLAKCGTRVPSTRWLASELGISRNVVPLA